MQKPINRAIREGYALSVKILDEQRTTYDGIEQLRTVQGRAIAVLAVDYLAGLTTSAVLLGVPLKGK